MRILIIEDDTNCRATLADLLELNGHTVIAAANGEEGLARVAEAPDLILCDIMMPQKGGLEVISEIRRNHAGRDIPFIFLSARASRGDLRQGMNLGADDYITKPYSEQDILDAIDCRTSRQREFAARTGRLKAEQEATANAPWSHELMTPLCGILGGLELIESRAGAYPLPDLKSCLEIIRHGAERQQQLSKKLVSYYELERARLAAIPPQMRSGDAGVAVRSAATRIATAEHRTADLQLACDSTANVALWDSFLRLSVTELVHNALRFSTPRDPVQVSCGRDGATFRVSVVDRGPGMTAGQIAQVGPFRQFGRREREQQGLGLGLAIAQSAARLAGGSLRLQAGPDAIGLTATLELPVS